MYFFEPIITPDDSQVKYSEYIFEKRWFSLFFVVNMAAWIVGTKLMHYEYRKRLSEAHYAHWFFWTSMLIGNVAFLILNFSYYVRIAPPFFNYLNRNGT